VDSQDYSALSVFTQAAFDVQRALKVSAGAFMPAPKVDSTVVVLTPHAGEPRAAETRVFREVVRLAFGQRRKTLRNAWKQLGGLDREALEALATTAGVSLDARAETLAVEDFGRVAAALETLRRGA
jgi:16S rRNA (adenine1518-N6/adenine1519-N6)-dimethyltransferase